MSRSDGSIVMDKTDGWESSFTGKLKLGME